MSEQARISFTINGNTFEISGPESFVSAQAEAFRESINQILATSVNARQDELPAGDDEAPAAAPHVEPTEKASYPRVLHIEGEKIQILKSVAGTTVSKKAVGTAVIYLWAKRQAGIDSVPFSELRELCKIQGCLDPANFAGQMKNAKSWIVVDGTKGSSAQTCKLTVPGVEKAESLLKELNAEQST